MKMCNLDERTADLSILDQFLAANYRRIEEAQLIAGSRTVRGETKETAKKLMLVFNNAQTLVIQCRASIVASKASKD